MKRQGDGCLRLMLAAIVVCSALMCVLVIVGLLLLGDTLTLAP